MFITILILRSKGVVFIPLFIRRWVVCISWGGRLNPVWWNNVLDGAIQAYIRAGGCCCYKKCTVVSSRNLASMSVVGFTVWLKWHVFLPDGSDLVLQFDCVTGASSPLLCIGLLSSAGFAWSASELGFWFAVHSDWATLPLFLCSLVFTCTCALFLLSAFHEGVLFSGSFFVLLQFTGMFVLGASPWCFVSAVPSLIGDNWCFFFLFELFLSEIWVLGLFVHICLDIL